MVVIVIVVAIVVVVVVFVAAAAAAVVVVVVIVMMVIITVLVIVMAFQCNFSVTNAVQRHVCPRRGHVEGIMLCSEEPAGSIILPPKGICQQKCGATSHTGEEF